MSASYRLTVVCASAVLAACTSVVVKPVDRELHQVRHICIQENPRVLVAGFPESVEQGLQRHGLTSERYAGYSGRRFFGFQQRRRQPAYIYNHINVSNDCSGGTRFNNAVGLLGIAATALRPLVPALMVAIFLVTLGDGLF